MLLFWTLTEHGLFMDQSVARGQTSALPAGSSAERLTGVPQYPGGDGQT